MDQSPNHEPWLGHLMCFQKYPLQADELQKNEPTRQVWPSARPILKVPLWGRPITGRFPFLWADSLFGLDPCLSQKTSGWLIAAIYAFRQEAELV